MATRTSIGEAAEAVFASAPGSPATPYGATDPSERLEFSRPPGGGGLQRFDARSDEELEAAVFAEASPMERERALWEYADRRGAAAHSSLSKAALADPDPALRSGALWAIQKFSIEEDAVRVLIDARADDEPEVQDWAALLLREITGSKEFAALEQPLAFDDSNPFDQTLPLAIAGYARVVMPEGAIQATLSPQWFESIMGRVMACTRVETLDSDLVIEKRLAGLHEDGSNHYEIYGFRGLTQRISPEVRHHHYECLSYHTFYPSGKVEDTSIAPEPDVGVVLNRVAETVIETSAGSRPIVRSVRGRYMGLAYVNVERILANGMKIGPGEVQLASPNHPRVGHLANTLIFGTFKGKLSDLDGDGRLDVNTEPCHGTIAGELDLDLDGRPDRDPYDAFAGA